VSPARVAQHAPRVLVIYKKSAYQIYVRERRHALIERLVKAREPSASRLLRAHRDHVRTIDETRAALLDLGARAVFRHRSEKSDVEDCDLVVTLGGDGTLLWASHLVGAQVPVVAINTAPKDSVGYFCAGDRSGLVEILDQALRGKLRETTLSRMRVDIDGKLVTKRVLNDALFCHECPASTSRYGLFLRGFEEEQKSSGVWVGPAAGSTAAQYSAGGRILPVRSRQLQYVIREPYTQGARIRYKHLRGLVRPGERLRIESRMRSGRLFLDGPHDGRGIEMASCIDMSLSDEPLSLLGFRGQRHTHAAANHVP
jgi:NAD+ kinase